MKLHFEPNLDYQLAAIASSIQALRDAPPIPNTRLQWHKADIAIGKAGVAAIERDSAATVVLNQGDIELPDLLTELQDRTHLIAARKSVYEQVVYELGTEATFANQMEKNAAIKVYAKLPGWFTVPTPLGSYNPDWAVLVEQDGAERLYFVVETQSSLFTDDLRDQESARIECGKAHFKALAAGETPVQYRVARSLDDVLISA